MSYADIRKHFNLTDNEIIRVYGDEVHKLGYVAHSSIAQWLYVGLRPSPQYKEF